MADDHEQKRKPFPLYVSVTGTEDEVELSLEVTAQDPQGSLGLVARIVNAFVTAANAAMFSVDPSSMEPSTMQVVSTETPAARSIYYAMKARGVQLGAYKVLINVLTKVHFVGLPLESVRLASSSIRGRRLDSQGLFKAPFPNVSRRVPFEVRILAALVDVKQPTIRFEFRHDISDGDMQILVAPLDAWDHLVAWGGYMEEFEERQLRDPVFSQETHMSAPGTVEHTYHGIVPTEAAFDSLINMGVNLHYSFHPLSAVEIE